MKEWKWEIINYYYYSTQASLFVTRSNGSKLWDLLPHCFVLSGFPADCHSQPLLHVPEEKGSHGHFRASLLASSFSILQPLLYLSTRWIFPYAIFIRPRPSLETNRGKALLNWINFLFMNLAFKILHNLLLNIHFKCTDLSSERTQILSTPVRLVYLCHLYSYNSAFWIEKEGSLICRHWDFAQVFWSLRRAASCPIFLSEVYPPKLASYLISG